jgi:hypothetical protein
MSAAVKLSPSGKVMARTRMLGGGAQLFVGLACGLPSAEFDPVGSPEPGAQESYAGGSGHLGDQINLMSRTFCDASISRTPP